MTRRDSARGRGRTGPGGSAAWPGAASSGCPRSAAAAGRSPPSPSRQRRVEGIPALPRLGSIATRISPRRCWGCCSRPCPAPFPLTGARCWAAPAPSLLRGFISPSADHLPSSRYCGLGGALRSATPAGLVFGTPPTPRCSPWGLCVKRAVCLFFLLVFFNPGRVAASTEPDLNIHYFSVCSFPLGNEVHGGEREGVLLLRNKKGVGFSGSLKHQVFSLKGGFSKHPGLGGLSGLYPA